MTNDRKKIIAVDDNLENLTAIKNIMKDTYDVYPVIKAAKMFDLLEHFLPDLILLDVEMPDMNGYEVARMLKNSDNFKKIPVIFLTFMDSQENEIEGLNLGAVDYIRKPLIGPLLLQRIEIHLSSLDPQKKVEKLFELKMQENNLRKSFD